MMEDMNNINYLLYYNMQQFIAVILLVCCTSLATSTKLTLISAATTTQPDNQQQSIQQKVEIPQVYDHPFSCQLVFFTVHNNKFIANITDVPTNVTELTFQISMREQQVFSRTGAVKNNTMKKQQNSYEVIMQFETKYKTVGNENQIVQQRKSYMLFCQQGEEQYIVKLPTITIAITQIIGLVFILILPWNIQYRKFLPFTFNILTSFLYILVLVIALYLQIIFGNGSLVYDFQRFFVAIFQLVCLVMYSQDLLMLCFSQNRIAFVFGFLFSLAVMGLDFFYSELQDAWFLNDIIAIMVAGAFIKFVIIRKVKSAVWALGIMWVFCAFREFAKQFGLQRFDQGLGYRSVPLFFQLPTFWQGNQSSISCSAFGSSKIIAFGVILNYCKRVDLYLSTQFYRILLSLLTVICITAQLVFNILFQDLPTIQMMSILLYYPLAIFLLLFFAEKRGEWAEIWHGSFYDMAVNRASIPRSVSFQGLQSDFGRDLLLNSGESDITDKQKGKEVKR